MSEEVGFLQDIEVEQYRTVAEFSGIDLGNQAQLREYLDKVMGSVYQSSVIEDTFNRLYEPSRSSVDDLIITSGDLDRIFKGALEDNLDFEDRRLLESRVSSELPSNLSRKELEETADYLVTRYRSFIVDHNREEGGLSVLSDGLLDSLTSRIIRARIEPSPIAVRTYLVKNYPDLFVGPLGKETLKDTVNKVLIGSPTFDEYQRIKYIPVEELFG